MKTILIPTEDHDAMPAVLEAARLMVAKSLRQLHGRFRGFLGPAKGDGVGGSSPVMLLSTWDDGEDREPGALGQFEAFMRAHDVPLGATGRRGGPILPAAVARRPRLRHPSSATAAAPSI